MEALPLNMAYKDEQHNINVIGRHLEEGKKKKKRKRMSMEAQETEQHGEKEGGENDVVKESAELPKRKIERKLTNVPSRIMTNVSFTSLGLSEPTLKAINDMGFRHSTQVNFISISSDIT